MGQEDKRAHSKPRVLIVEDEWLVAEDFGDILHRAGYHIVGPAHDAARANALIDTEMITAALLDINLGGHLSYPIAGRLRDLNIPYAFVTGYNAADLPPDAKGPIVVNKPVRDEMLRQVVSRLLAGNA